MTAGLRWQNMYMCLQCIKMNFILKVCSEGRTVWCSACFTCAGRAVRWAAGVCSAALRVCVRVCVRPCAAASEERYSCSRSTVTCVCNSQKAWAPTRTHAADRREEPLTDSLQRSETSETWTHTHTHTERIQPQTALIEYWVNSIIKVCSHQWWEL